MRHVRVLLPTIALVLVAAPAQARVVTPDSARVAPSAAPRAEAPIPAEVQARVAGLRDEARAQFEAGRYAEARRQLMVAASVKRQAGALPVDELFTVATIALVEERPLVAAAAMDDLAANAEAFGQPSVEAQALLESATQYAAAGERDIARERLALLHTLLASSELPSDVRASVQTRVVAAR